MNFDIEMIRAFCQQNQLLTAAVFGAAGLAAVGTVFDPLWLKKMLRAERDRSATHGSARFAEADEIEEKGLLHDGKTLMTLASYGNKFIGAPVHALVCAPTGSGKGVGIVVPTLLNYSGSVLVNDPKGENLAITARYREELGQEIVSFDPWGKGTKLCGRESAMCNPLFYFDKNSKDVVTRASQLMRTICGAKIESGQNSIFYETAESIITFFILYVVITETDENKRNLVQVRKLALSKPETFKKILEHAMTLPDCEGELATNAESFYATAFNHQKDDESLSFYDTFKSFLGNVKNFLSFLEDTHIKDFFSGNTYDLSKVQSEPTSVYVIVDASKSSISSVFMRIVYSTVLYPMLEIEEPEGLPLLVIIDELVQLGKFELLEKTISIIRSNGVRYLLIIQNMQQLKNCYKDGAEDITANTQLTAFSPSTFDAQELLSKRLGKKTITVFSENGKGQKTKSKVGKDLMTVEELGRLKNDTVLVFPWECPPIKTKKVKFFTDKRFAGKYDPKKHDFERLDETE